MVRGEIPWPPFQDFVAHETHRLISLDGVFHRWKPFRIRAGHNRYGPAVITSALKSAYFRWRVFCWPFLAFADAMRAVNTIAKLITFSFTAAFLAGCASTDFQLLESQGPVVAQGQ
jgi:hypothetical protein